MTETGQPVDRVDAILETLWTSGPHGKPDSQVFAVLDGARLPDLPDRLRRSRLDHQCLIPGQLIPRLARAAPYLVSLGRRSSGTRDLVWAAWSSSGSRGGGIFLRSEAVLQELRRHLYRLFQVQDVGGRSFYLRFYDPSVLSAYLPTCTREELAFFFGAADSFHIERRSDQMVRYCLVDTTLGKELQEEVLDLRSSPVSVVSWGIVSSGLRGPVPGSR